MIVEKKEDLLEVENLSINIPTINGKLGITEGVNFRIKRGEVLALVGESGCGKSMTALSLLQLLPRKAEINGSIIFKGNELINASKDSIRKIRGKSISMIFQEPMSSLNPVQRVGNQIVETIRNHLSVTKKEAIDLSIDMLRKVGIPDPTMKAKAYPHQLSGGQRQRVMIAMALACKPDLLIADEPTTALDVTIQAQILDLIKSFKDDFGTSMLFISHDLGVVSEVADRVAVMYAGRIVEESSSEEIIRNPAHPYTKGLLNSIPDNKKRGEILNTIKGAVPSPEKYQTGCRFYDRCPNAMDVCIQKEPKLKEANNQTKTACYLYS